MNEQVVSQTRMQRGFTLLEALVAIGFCAILSVSITMSLVTAIRTEKITETHFAASTIASGRVETISAVDVADIDSSYNETDTAVTWGDMNLTFFRTTAITLNADNSRTITVMVRTNHGLLPSKVRFQTTLAVWE